MSYDFIIIDSVICESYNEVMYDEDDPNRDPLLDLQKMSGDLVADKKRPLLWITSTTRKLIEEKYNSNGLPISISCLLEACGEIDISSKDEVDSIIKASSYLDWKKENFCIFTGNSLLKGKIREMEFEVYDLSQANDVYEQLQE